MGFMNLFKPKSALPKYNSNVRPYLDTYEDKPMYTLVDLGLFEIAPSPDFTRYIAVLLPVRINEGSGPAVSDAELKVLHRIEEKCMREAEQKGFLYAGHAIVTADEQMYIAFYCREKDKNDIVESLKRICQSNGKDPVRIVCKTDREWGFYLERLYPDIYHMQEMNHQDIIDDVRKHGDSGAAPRAVSFWMYFGTKEDAERCLDEAVSSGFTLENLNDMSGEKKFSGKKPYALTVKREMPLVLEQLNAESRRLIDMVKNYDGDYDGIETEVVKGG